MPTKLEGRNDTPRILAVDPALSTTGYAVISIADKKIVYANKFCTSSKKSYDERVTDIVTELFSIAVQYGVVGIVLENSFLGKNPKTAMDLSELRGSICGVFAFNKYLVCKMTPSEIRAHLGIGGGASKLDVAMYLINTLYKDDPKIQKIGPYSDKQNKDKTSDIYDAISIGAAFCEFSERGSANA